MQPSAPALAWGLPFAGLLASMAVFPVLAPRFWHRQMGLIALVWSVALLAQQAAVLGAFAAAAAVWHALLVDYLPFIALMLALYTAGGGVLLRGGLSGTPLGNTAMLGLGMVMGTVMGTTGASMVLIHPLLHANAHRQRKMHLVLFLVILVANASGALTPLGNPPLYLGLLHGVPFFWPARNLWLPLVVVTGTLLAACYLIDLYLARQEPPAPKRERFRVRGWLNVGMILLVVLVVLGQGLVPARMMILLGEPVPLALPASVAALLLIALISVATTARAIHQANDFSWHPMVEIAVLFAAIFITIAPVQSVLEAGLEGPLAPLLRLSLDSNGHNWPLAYFWLTGILSAFLDNAPTYLVFFELAGIRPAQLSGAQAVTLQAISAGAVFFGGLTYIGNAPNMMLRAIAAHRGVRMPGFFGFMAMSSLLLLPVLVLVSLLFFT
ncbi:MAG TPA: sodium:proton antiporter [Acetobacteraceae bacterium]|nr:sodium:proton antiporter [Acetobacteraceae bacterium]